MFSLLFLFIVDSSWGALPNSTSQENYRSSPIRNTYSIKTEQISALGHRIFKGESGGLAALNQDFTNGKITIPAGEVVVIEGNEVFAFDKKENPFVLGVLGDEISEKDLTILSVNTKTGEVLDYNIPSDLTFAGKGKIKKRKGKVTYCYRHVKAKIRNYVTLTGGSAYMAYSQLERKGFTRMSYAEAPYGSICVFGRGGRRTASGGHKHGHIGLKGSGGVIDPRSGFALGRPFLGCYNPKES